MQYCSVFVNISCHRQTVRIKYYERVLSVCPSLVIQHAMHMCLIVLTTVACLALSYFSTLSHIQHDFFLGGVGEEKT